MKTENEIIGGLRPLTEDDRDLKVGAIFTLPKLNELPSDFVVDFPTVVNQDEKETTDYCGAASSSSVSELQEKVPLCFEWVFAVAKMLEGDPNSWGTDLRTICKVHTKFGAPERADSLYSLENKSALFLRDIKNWPDLYDKALKHKKESYFSVSGPYDHFDNIRASMWKFRDKECGVLFGVMWSWSLSQIFMNEVVPKGTGHALAGIGWKTIHNEPLMFIQNSMGEWAGEGGRHYFSREVINAFVDKYGAFMFNDMPKEDARYLQQNRLKVEDGRFKRFIKLFILNPVFNLFKKYGYQ